MGLTQPAPAAHTQVPATETTPLWCGASKAKACSDSSGAGNGSDGGAGGVSGKGKDKAKAAPRGWRGVAAAQEDWCVRAGSLVGAHAA